MNKLPSTQAGLSPTIYRRNHLQLVDLVAQLQAHHSVESRLLAQQQKSTEFAAQITQNKLPSFKLYQSMRPRYRLIIDSHLYHVASADFYAYSFGSQDEYSFILWFSLYFL